jgi:adenylate cyclase
MSKRIPILLGFILLIITIWLQISAVDLIQHYIGRLKELGYDIQLKSRILTQRNAFESTIVIVDIDDKSLDKEGRWPWPRAKLGDLISRLFENGAVVVALDVIFPEKEDNIVDTVSQSLSQNQLMVPPIQTSLDKIKPFFNNDAKFAENIKKGDVVLGASFLPRPLQIGTPPAPILTLTTEVEKKLDFIWAKGIISNIPILQNEAKSGGFINIYADEDGIIRRVPILIRYQDNLYPSLAVEAVRVYLLGEVKLITEDYGDSIELEGVQVENHKIPTDNTGQTVIPFRGRSYSFPYLSATDVLHNTIPSDSLNGKIVFVGTSATGLGDLPATAVEGAYPGVEIQATIADAILTDRFFYKPAWSLGAEVFLTAVLGSIICVLFPYLGPSLLSIFMILIPLGLVFANNWLWEKTGFIISIFIPMCFTLLLGVVDMVYGYLFESRRRTRLKAIFGQYVPSKHIDEMLQSKGDYGMLGEDRDMTVLFADIRHFTSISEHLPASQLKELLNEFFTPMTEIIFKYHGTIDKYVGDLIMAFWGAPLKDKKHAQRAIGAAIDMQLAVQELQPVLAQHGWPAIRIGIGINSGMMSVGDMGSKFRRNYTVLGDAVNLASRVEGLTKFYGVQIIVTENTFREQPRFIFRQLDRVRVKGKDTGIAIYEVIGRKNEMTPDILKELELSERALNFYFNRDWKNALDLFSELKLNYPNVKLYSIYLQRVSEFMNNPPALDWDGVYSHLAK